VRNAGERLTVGTMNVSLPDALREFVDEQVAQGGYGTSSEYVRELIRKDQERLRQHALMLEGAELPLRGKADARYFQALRKRASARKRRA
jgi:antitoxin ParD1/3/4